MSDHAAESLWNRDLAPTDAAQRTWRWYHFAALWIGMIVAVPSWMLASGLIEQGMSAGQAAATVLLGNVMVLVPLLLIGHAGARHGIPYAVLARASFGTRGARLPAMARALVACGWFGIQTWIGDEALYREDGRYAYAGGWNRRALIAFAIGVLPNLPGFLATVAPGSFAWIGGFWTGLYAYAWFIGLFLALGIYTLLMRSGRLGEVPERA